jgi:pheromone shutdown protein TraB
VQAKKLVVLVAIAVNAVSSVVAAVGVGVVAGLVDVATSAHHVTCSCGGRWAGKPSNKS